MRIFGFAKRTLVIIEEYRYVHKETAIDRSNQLACAISTGSPPFAVMFTEIARSVA
jgi:hypothetical protein